MALRLTLGIVAVGCTILGCGGGGSQARPPVANALSISGPEDMDIAGRVTGVDLGGSTVSFRIAAAPQLGSVQLEPTSGDFVYRGPTDYVGDDHFEFQVVAADGRASAPARVSIVVTAVNDAPRIAAILDTGNSPELHEVSVQYVVHDVEGDALQLFVEVEDLQIAAASIDSASSVIIVRPGNAGTTRIVLRASDGQLEATETFEFEVAPVTKSRAFQLADPFSHAVEIVNVGNDRVEFLLRHNGARLATTRAELVEEALSTDDGRNTSPDHALWAYVNNSTYHWYSLTPARWLHDPLVLLNSVGFGLCDDVAAALVLMARDAGLKGDVWNLEGHVVAELVRGGAGRMYDADLSIYYSDDAGSVAGVAALMADTTLITEPRYPIYHDPTSVFAYSESLASIYGSTEDNNLANWNTETMTENVKPIELVPGASLRFPGIWADAPFTTGGDGLEAPVHSTLTLTLPAGWVGIASMPLVLKSIRGQGTVRLGGTDFEAGSAALQLSLDNPTFWIAGVEIISSTSDIELTYLLNPLRFREEHELLVDVTGVNVWALEIDTIELPESNRRSEQPTDELRKPVF